jgi:tripartite-type tricarboxylate transporter receptor subunit TctC
MIQSATRHILTLLMLGVASVPLAAAQGYPSRTIEMVVPQPPGGVNDLPARLIGAKLNERYGQSVVVLNKPGAGGSIGSQAVVRAKADGYSLLLNGTGMVFNAALDNSPFKVPDDLTVIAKVADFPSVVAISATIPARTVEEFVKWTQQNPAKANYGSAGVGSGGHIFGSAFVKETGATMTHVPFMGGPPAVNAMLSGDIAMFIAPVGLVKQFVQSGRLRALAVTSDHRLADFPSVPTMAEAGYPKFVASQWFGVFGPRGMPPAIVSKLGHDISEIVMEPDVKQDLARSGIISAPLDSEAFRAQLEREVAYWTKMVHDLGVKKD